jgi:hypothetical protein
MSKSVLTILCLAALSLISQPAHAAIVLAIGSGSFAPNSGVQPIDILVRSDSGDTSLFLTADFQLAAGVFPATAGVFGQPGMVGSGNIQDPPASQFVSAGNNSATLSLDFTNAQLFPATNTLLGRMFIDTTGLAQGTYSIQVTSFATQVASSSTNGSFTITTVPEPGSLCLVGMASLWVWRRSRKLPSFLAR